MKNRKLTIMLSLALLLGWGAVAEAGEPSPSRFQKGHIGYGLGVGFGTGLDIPSGAERTDSQYGFFAPNMEYDLTGNVGKGAFYQGNLDVVNEITILAFQYPNTSVLAGWSPMLEYKFVKPTRKWAPTFLAGIGFAYTDFDRDVREIAGDFQFLLHFGAGIEFYDTAVGDFSVNYRLLHISNAGIESPNIGLNTGLVSLGFKF